MQTAPQPGYLHHLTKDKHLRKIIIEPLPPLQTHRHIPLRLMANIMGQQLNTRVAKVIYKRFLDLFNGEPTPEQVLATSYDSLRAIGLSNAKAGYVKNVAAYCLEHVVTDEKLLALSNQEIIDLLSKIKGVGQWTVEMLLMFSLGREDVFSAGDLGIQQAMTKLYGLKTGDKKGLIKEIMELSEPWKPFRTFGCLYLWNWKDNKG